jgi:hypothetical protein
VVVPNKIFHSHDNGPVPDPRNWSSLWIGARTGDVRLDSVVGIELRNWFSVCWIVPAEVPVGENLDPG